MSQFKALCPVAPGQPNSYICPIWVVTGFFLLQHKRATSRGDFSYGGPTHTCEADIEMSLLYRVMCCSIQCLAVLFYLATQIPRCSRQKCLESSPVIGNQYEGGLERWKSLL